MHSVNLDVYRLAHEYPHLVKRRVRMNPDNGGESPVISVRFCDYAAMKDDRGFMNDLSDNLGRYSAYLDFVFGKMDDSLTRLHALLDVEIQLTHPEQDVPEASRPAP